MKKLKNGFKIGLFNKKHFALINSSDQFTGLLVSVKYKKHVVDIFNDHIELIGNDLLSDFYLIKPKF